MQTIPKRGTFELLSVPVSDLSPHSHEESRVLEHLSLVAYQLRAPLSDRCCLEIIHFYCLNQLSSVLGGLVRNS